MDRIVGRQNALMHVNLSLKRCPKNNNNKKFKKCQNWKCTWKYFFGGSYNRQYSWNVHVRHIKPKISKSFTIINTVKIYLDVNALCVKYYCSVLPYFTYCVIVWGNSYQCTINPLAILQKKAIWIIHEVGFLEPHIICVINLSC